MCGIAGMADLSGAPVDESPLRGMIADMAYRGPDDRGIFADGAVALAHCRLAIIDPAGGAQPWVDARGRAAVTSNGEIYNYRELRAELAPDEPFVSQSDTEVLLRAYLKWGISFLDRLRGMFSFGLYDRADRRLYLVRDRVGIKPLFYWLGGSRVLFSSELRPLVRSGGVPRAIDGPALADYFRFQYVPAPATIYQGIRKLEPGHVLTIDLATGTTRDRAYWVATPGALEEDDDDRLLDRLRAKLDEAVGLHVRSDVPFGSFLSGGVDSGIVTGLMAGHLQGRVRTFSIGFWDESFSELPVAARVARHLGAEHAAETLEPALEADLLPRIVRSFGEPFADASAIPTYRVARLAARQVKMVLSGDGGDELFGGYDSYRQVFARVHDSTWPVWRMACRAAAGLCGSGRVGRALTRRGLTLEEVHRSQRECFCPEELDELLVTRAGHGRPAPPTPPFSPRDPLVEYQWRDFRTYLVDDILTKVDRMSMMNSLEVRVPFLDHEVVQLAFSLPLRLRIRREGSGVGTETKYALRRLAANLLPEEVLRRPKTGFGAPLAAWCRCLWPEIGNLLRDPHDPMFEVVRFPVVSRIADDFAAGRESTAARVWFLYLFGLWVRYVHLEPPAANPMPIARWAGRKGC